jgi:excisionase family DNA binding protein
MITPERARLYEALAQVVDGLVELVSAGVVERLRPELGEIRGAVTPVVSTPGEPAKRATAPSDLLTISEAAKVLNVAKSTVSWWVHRAKTLPSLHVGPGPGRRLVRIRRADLEEFVVDNSHRSARDHVLELLAASEQRSADRRRRRLERGDARSKSNVRPLRAPATR